MKLSEADLKALEQVRERDGFIDADEALSIGEQLTALAATYIKVAQLLKFSGALEVAMWRAQRCGGHELTN